MFPSIRSALLLIPIGSIPLAVSKKANNHLKALINKRSRLSYFISQSFSTFSKLKSNEYLRKLLKGNKLTPELASRDPAELDALISNVLSQYEYKLYCNGYDFSNPITKKDRIAANIFQLKLFELQGILEEKVASKRSHIMDVFIKNKILECETLEESEHFQKTNSTGPKNPKNDFDYGPNCNTKFDKNSTCELFERRYLDASKIPDNPRLVLDLDYTDELEFFTTQRICRQIRWLLEFNLSSPYYPFTVEFSRSHTRPTQQFDNEMCRVVSPHWNEPNKFLYPCHQGKSISQLCSKPESIFYINPGALVPLTIEEVLNPEHVFVLPAYDTSNVRDPVFTKMNYEMEQMKVNTRRLPATEYVFWNSFHGAIEIRIAFQILHDIRYEKNADWKTVLERRLAKLIKKEESLSSIIFSQKREMRKLSMLNSYSKGPVIKHKSGKSNKK